MTALEYAEMMLLATSRIDFRRALSCLTLIVGLWLQAPAESAAQGHEKRFAKALKTLRSQYDSVKFSFLDRPKSRYGYAVCYRDIAIQSSYPVLDSNGNGLLDSAGNYLFELRQENSTCVQDVIIDVDGAIYKGRYDESSYQELNTSSPELIIQDVYESWCDSMRNEVSRRVLSEYDKRGLYNRGFYRLFAAAKSSPIDSGYIQSIYNGRYLKIIRDDRVNFYDVGSGLLFKWDDPLTYKLAHMYKSGSTVRLIARFDDRNWQILYPDGSPTSGFSYRFIDFYSESSSSERTIRAGLVIDEDEDNDVNVDLDMISGAPAAAKVVIDFKYCQWWYCPRTRGCIHRIQFSTVENRFPNRSVSRALVMVELTDKSSNTVVYRKRHWIELNLGPREVGSSNEIPLDNEVWADDLTWRVEILDYQ